MDKLYGYNGKIAYINLSSSKIEIKDLDPENPVNPVKKNKNKIESIPY